jgi:ABC-2 type transport system ATP-binding protein
MDTIRVEHLVKRFGELLAVDDVSFTVGAGEFFGSLGPNGAGKTTTINVLCTLLRPTSGNVLINGFDVVSEPHQVRRSIGLVFQDPTLDERLTAFENLEFHARVYNVPSRLWRTRAEQLLEIVELADRRDHLVKTFSGGMRRRLELARGLLHHPRVLFLDEPTIGLDPQTRRHIWRYMLELHRREGVTLFLTTHYIEEAEACDHVAIIDQGKIVALDTPDRLKRLVGQDVITLQTADLATALTRLHERFHLNAVPDDGHVRIDVANGERLIPELVSRLGVPITGVTLHQPTLEDVFIKLTGAAIRDRDDSGEDAGRARIAARRRR